MTEQRKHLPETQNVMIERFCFSLRGDSFDRKRQVIESIFGQDTTSSRRELPSWIKESPEQEILSEQLFELGLLRILHAVEYRKQRRKGLKIAEVFPGQIRITEEDIWFAASVELAKRGGNSFKENIALLDNGSMSKFGQRRLSSAEDVQWSDHGKDHFRRVERYIDAQFENLQNIRSEHLRSWLDALYLFPYWHDVAQILRYQRNEDRKPNRLPPYHVKVGHDLEAAIIVLTLTPEYATARGISFEEAQKQTVAFAFMCMGHDEMRDTYEQAIQAREKADPQEPTESLYEKYKKGRIDRRTLTYRQIFALYRYELEQFQRNKKKSEGYADLLEGSRYGLDPDFEEIYKHRLKQLSCSDESLFETGSDGNVLMDDDTYRALQEVARIALRADRAEFLMPGFHAVVRKLLTQYSQGRPLHRTNREELYEYAKKRGFVSLNGDPTISELMEYIAKHGEPNLPPNIDSDTLRSLIEIYELIKIHKIQKEHDPYLQTLNRDTAIMYAIAYKEIISRLMDPSIKNIRFIDSLFLREAASLGLKLARKYGIEIDFDPSIPVRQQMKTILYMLQSHQDLLQSYQKSISDIEQTRNELYKRIGGKPKRSGRWQSVLHIPPLFESEPHETMKVLFESYTKEEIFEFQLMMRECMEYLQETFDISAEHLNDYCRIFREGRNPPTVPYNTYYSTNPDLTKPRVLTKRPEQIALLLKI